jgi:hypothetical protein
MKRTLARTLAWTLHLFTHNFWWKVLSLAGAVIIWALVASEPELSTFATARVEYKNLSDDLELSSQPVGTVSLELRGPSGQLRGLGDGGIHPAVVLDMAGIGTGQHTFPLGEASVKLPRGVRLVGSIPPDVQFAFEPRLVRDAPVQVRFYGEGKNGFVVDHWNVTPKSVLIAGPQTHVARMTAAVTDPVDVSGLSGEAEFRVNAFVEDPFVRLESSPQVTVAVTMKRKQGGT